MQTAKLTVTLEVDGKVVEGFPIVRRLNLDEVQSFSYERATGGGFTDLPATEIANIQLLLVRSDGAITLRLDNQADAGIEISANGLVLVMDATIDSGANRARVDNNSGATATVKGVIGGT